MGGTQAKSIPPEAEPLPSDKETPVTSPNTMGNAPQSHVLESPVSDKIAEQVSLEPMEVVTKQTCSESTYVMRGKDGDRPAWHIILLSCDKHAVLQQRVIGSLIQVEEFGRNIEYRDKAGIVRQASGYGTKPPEQFIKWINDQYDPCAIDNNTSLLYTTDDIRLCTMHRVTPKDPLGIIPHYHRDERFHYVKLNDDYQSTLAFHAGIKSFDRVIEYDGINIEDNSADIFRKRIDGTDDYLVQLLVCSASTYTHYKKNNKRIHSNLETVKFCRPVRDTADISNTVSGTKDFCAIRWEDDHEVDVVSSSIILNSSQLIQLYGTYIIEINGQQRKGQVIFRGSKNECELLQTNNISQPYTIINTYQITNSTAHNADDNVFITAYQEPMIYNVEHNLVPVVKKSNVSKDPPTQTDSATEKYDDEKTKKDLVKQNLIQQLMVVLIDDQNKPENGFETHRAQCSGCGSPRIRSDRYKCLECHDYDLCGTCFDRRRETLRHINGHAMVYFSGPDEVFGEPIIDINTIVTLNKFKEKYAREEHLDVECNSCKMIPIIGLRFKCDVCHDYDLCMTCMEKREHDQSHPLITIGKNRFLEISMNDIILDDELGRGGFGTVYKAKWLSKNRSVACKVISVPPDKQHLEKSFRKELAAYAELSGPYILKTYGYNIQDLSTGIRKCMLVMEYMPRGSLSSVLKQAEKISLRRKLEMACQIASGMRKLHAHHMIHRDIRPDNILVTEDYIAKIADMGLARVWLPDEDLTLIGCMAYMPFDFYTGKYNQSLDVYTFGLTINELFTEKKHQFNLLTRRIKLINNSPIFADLIDRCIHVEPSQRPSAIEIEATLRMYKQAFEKYIVEQHIEYGDMSTEDKNRTFITIYEALHPEMNQVLKRRFPSCPSGGSTAGVNNDAIEVLQFLKLMERLSDH